MKFKTKPPLYTGTRVSGPGSPLPTSRWAHSSRTCPRRRSCPRCPAPGPARATRRSPGRVSWTPSRPGWRSMTTSSTRWAPAARRSQTVETTWCRHRFFQLSEYFSTIQKCNFNRFTWTSIQMNIIVFWSDSCFHTPTTTTISGALWGTGYNLQGDQWYFFQRRILHWGFFHTSWYFFPSLGLIWT